MRTRPFLEVRGDGLNSVDGEADALEYRLGPSTGGATRVTAGGWASREVIRATTVGVAGVGASEAARAEAEPGACAPSCHDGSGWALANLRSADAGDRSKLLCTLRPCSAPSDAACRSETPAGWTAGTTDGALCMRDNQI